MAKSQNKPTKKDSEKLYVKYNQRFQVDCQKLSKLIVAAKSGTKEEKIEKRAKRERMRESVMKSYDIPKRTLDKQLEKRFPGLRDKRTDAGTEKIKLPKIVDKIVTESMLAGKSKKEAVKIASEKIGKNISQHKALTIKTDKEITESSFGVDMQKFVAEIFEMDNIAPGAFILVKVKSKDKEFKFELHFETIHDIKLLLANEFNKSVEDRFKVIADKDQIREILLNELFDAQITVAKQSNSLKTVAELINIQKKIKIKDTILTPDFKTAFEAARVYNKTLTKKEYIAAIKLVSRGGANG